MDDYYINNPLVATHLLQHTLRSLCNENSLWIYAVFWRILPRNHPPPDWDYLQNGTHSRSRVNRTNWMLAWEDGFCNFFASPAESNPQTSSSADKNSDIRRNRLQPELFFKMSHEIYNYGEGLIGKVAADRSHKCVHSEQINLSAWQKSVDLHPRTWKAQFQCGIKVDQLQESFFFLTIALIAVDEGVLQLGAVRKVPEDLIFVAQIQKKFNNLQIIPGFLLPRPSSSPSTIHSTFLRPTPPIVIHNSFKINGFNESILPNYEPFHPVYTPLTTMDVSYDHFNQPPMSSLLSISSLEKLLLKLPSTAPASAPPLLQFHDESQPWFFSSQKPLELMGMEVENNENQEKEGMTCNWQISSFKRVCL